MTALAYSQVNDQKSWQAIKAHRDLVAKVVGRLVYSASKASRPSGSAGERAKTQPNPKAIKPEPPPQLTPQ